MLCDISKVLYSPYRNLCAYGFGYAVLRQNLVPDFLHLFLSRVAKFVWVQRELMIQHDDMTTTHNTHKMTTEHQIVWDLDIAFCVEGRVILCT